MEDTEFKRKNIQKKYIDPQLRDKVACKYVQKYPNFIPDEKTMPQAYALYQKLQMESKQANSGLLSININKFIKNLNFYNQIPLLLGSAFLFSFYYYIKIYVPQNKNTINTKMFQFPQYQEEAWEVDAWERNFEEENKNIMPPPRGYPYLTAFQIKKTEYQEAIEQENQACIESWKERKIKLREEQNQILQQFQDSKTF